MSFLVTIEETPVAGAPVLFNSDIGVTDENGLVTTQMVNTTLYSVSSAVDAITFPPLYNDGATFGLQSPVSIPASRLITLVEAPCRVVIDGNPHIYFSAVNQSSTALTVPLSYPGINSLLSVTGGAAPPESFGPGESGFTIPENHFVSSGGLTGEWRFLGATKSLHSSPDYCTAQGVPNQCLRLSDGVLANPFSYTRAVIQRISRQAVATGRRGAWAPAGGKFRLPFHRNAAKALAFMRSQGDLANRSGFVCEAGAMMTACERVVVRKKEYRDAFTKIFSGSWPRGLQRIQRRRTKEVAKFKKELDKLPDTYVSCSRNR